MRIEGLRYIYKIVNPKGKIYIGQTIDWQDRMTAYRGNYKSKQKLIYRSIKKYGWESHKISIIECCPETLANKREIFHIKNENSYYKVSKNGLNMTIGGDYINIVTQPILQYSLNGNFIKEWDSITSASFSFGKKASSAIGLCLADINKSAYGFMWRYKFSNNYPLLIEEIKRIKPTGTLGKKLPPSKFRKAILQYDLLGNFVREWESVNLASSIFGNRISACLNFKKNANQAGGFQWRYKESNYFPKTIAAVNSKNSRVKNGLVSLKCTNLSNNKDTIYNNIYKCAIENDIDFTQIYRVIKYNNGIAKNKKLKFELLENKTTSIT